MKTRILKVTCAVTIAAVLMGASARVARAQFPYVPSLPFSHSSTAEKVVTAAVIAATIYFIARYEADERQRQVAEMRARRAYAHMSAQRKAGMELREVRYISGRNGEGEEKLPQA